MLKNLLDKIKNDKHLLELLKGSAASFFLKIAGMILGYMVMFIVTRRYGADEYGILSLSMAVFSIAVLIGKAGIDTAITRFVAELAAIKETKSTFLLLLKSLFLVSMFSLVSFLILFNFSSLIAEKIFHKPHLGGSFRLISFCILPAASMAIIANIFQGLRKIKIYSLIVNIFLNAFFFILLILFVQEQNVIQLFFYASLGSFFISLGFIIYLFFQNDIDLKSKKITFRRILNTSLPMMFASAFAMLMSWTDIMMLGAMKSEAEVGIYAVVMKLASITGIALMAVNTISAPKFAEFKVKQDFYSLERIAKQSTKMIFYISLPILLVFLFLPEYILMMFGKEFIVGSSALVILAIGQLINSACGSVGVIMQMTGMQYSFQKIMLLAVIINIVLNFLLIPGMSIYGAAIASMLSIIIWNLSAVYVVYKKNGFITMYMPVLKLNRE